MTTARLLEHYETRYRNDAHEVVTAYPLVKCPDNRFEATVKAMHQLFKGGSILEVGCGNGRIAKSLLDSGLPFDSYVMSDLSRPRAEAARAHLKDKRFEISILDIETADNWPLAASQKFDAIMMVALIEHLVDPISAMARLRQHVKPGGFVYILTPNVARWTKRLALLAGKVPATASKQEGLVCFDGQPVDLLDCGHLHYFTFSNLSRMLTERCGFSHCVPMPSGKVPALAPNPLSRRWLRHGPGCSASWRWLPMLSNGRPV